MGVSVNVVKIDNIPHVQVLSKTPGALEPQILINTPVSRLLAPAHDGPAARIMLNITDTNTLRVAHHFDALRHDDGRTLSGLLFALEDYRHDHPELKDDTGTSFALDNLEQEAEAILGIRRG